MLGIGFRQRLVQCGDGGEHSLARLLVLFLGKILIGIGQLFRGKFLRVQPARYFAWSSTVRMNTKASIASAMSATTSFSLVSRSMS